MNLKNIPLKGREDGEIKWIPDFRQGVLGLRLLQMLG
jgi:hypothetical protein